MKIFSQHYLERILSTIYYEYLPERIKKFLSRIRLALKFLILPRIYYLSLSMYLLYGKEKQHGSDLNILLISDKDTLSYISSILYSKEPSVENLGFTFIWNAKKNVSYFSKNMDAIFIKTDRFFSGFLQKNDFIIIPEWANMWLDISIPLKNIYKNFKTSAKRDISNIKKYQYTYEISKDSKKLDFFYNELCLPFVSQRYTNLALPEGTNYQDIKSIFEDGKLLLIKDKDKYVSGIVFKIKNKSIFPVYLGVSTDPDYLTRALELPPIIF